MDSTPRGSHELCEASVNYVLRRINTIQYLIQSIEQISGHPFSRDRIKCLSSSLFGGISPREEQSVSAGYMWRKAPHQKCDRGDVVLLEDVLEEHLYRSPIEPLTDEVLEKHFNKALKHVEKNLRHELIHAFDDTRGFLNPSDCLHQACSEIRAARLSGDCFTGEELKRWRWNLIGGSKNCVQRRAVSAVETNPICRGFSARAVEKMFPRCYYDYEPYAAPLYTMGSHGDEVFPNGTTSTLNVV